MKKSLFASVLFCALASCAVTELDPPPIEPGPGCPCGVVWSYPPADNCDNGIPCTGIAHCLECEPTTSDPNAQCCGDPEPTTGASGLICPGDAGWPEQCSGYNPGTGGDEGEGGIDSSGGEECGDHATYVCRGWVAGIYESASANPPRRFNFLNPPDQITYAECVEFPICIPSLGDEDSEALFDACEATCLGMVANDELPMSGPYPFNPDIGGASTLWELETTVCVFGEEGENGVVPAGTNGLPANVGTLPNVDGHSFCEAIIPDGTLDPTDCGGTGCKPQTLFAECVPEGECLPPESTCDDWSPLQSGNQTPAPSIATSTNALTKVVTVSLTHAFLDAQFANAFSHVYVCDGGGLYDMSATLGTSWKFVNLAALGFWYELGFRTGDHLKRVRVKTGPTTYGSWYSLESLGAMLNVYGAMNGANSLQIEFARPVGSLMVTYTMNVTLT